MDADYHHRRFWVKPEYWDKYGYEYKDVMVLFGRPNINPRIVDLERHEMTLEQFFKCKSDDGYALDGYALPEQEDTS